MPFRRNIRLFWPRGIQFYINYRVLRHRVFLDDLLRDGMGWPCLLRSCYDNSRSLLAIVEIANGWLTVAN